MPSAAFRYTVLGLVALAAFIAACSWLVRTRRVSPFGALGKTLRAISDPVMRPVERRLVRMGGNPAGAGGWLVVVTAVVGIVVLSLAGWLVGTFYVAQAAAQHGPRATASLTVEIVYKIVIFALVVRIIASWFGFFRYSKWIRPAYVLTDWIVEPLRRVIPPMGSMDVTPLVAWFALWLIRGFIHSILGA